MKTKSCRKCLKIKPLTGFYRHPGMTDGHLHECIICRRQYAVAHRAKNLDHARELDRVRGRTEERRALAREYRKTPRGMRAMSSAKKRWIANNPHKRKAHLAVLNAIRSCSLLKLDCELCGNSRSEAHHDDYSKPLTVVWLCDKHHKERHLFLNEQRRKAMKDAA
jgi:hypothetical protein